MHNPRPSDAVKVRGRGGGECDGQQHQPPYSASCSLFRPDLRSGPEVTVQARRKGDLAAIVAERLAVSSALEIRLKANLRVAVRK